MIMQALITAVRPNIVAAKGDKPQRDYSTLKLVELGKSGDEKVTGYDTQEISCTSGIAEQVKGVVPCWAALDVGTQKFGQETSLRVVAVTPLGSAKDLFTAGVKSFAPRA